MKSTLYEFSKSFSIDTYDEIFESIYNLVILRKFNKQNRRTIYFMITNINKLAKIM